MAAIGVSRFCSIRKLSEARTVGNRARIYRPALTGDAAATQSLDREETKKTAPRSYVHLYHPPASVRGADRARRVDRRVHGIARSARRSARRDLRPRGFHQT